MINLISIMIGGGFGAVTRAGVTHLLARFPFKLPIATLIVNLIGCFTISLISGIALSHEWFSALITIGFLGGLTTFSTLSLELEKLLTESRKLYLFMLYSAMQYLLCFAACILGYNLAS